MFRKAIIAIILMFAGGSSVFASKPVITVNQYVSHIALDQVYDGLMKAFADEGVDQKYDMVYSNAQGNISNSVQIAKHHASLEPEFMVAIATPAAQASAKAVQEGAMLAFAAVTDPEAANLHNKDNIMGVSDAPPINELVDLAKLFFNDLHTIGVIYNSGEINSVMMVERLETKAKKDQIKIVKIAVNSLSDIKIAFGKLRDKVDVVYLPQDNVVISALESVVGLSRSSKVPLIANDPTLVQKGVMMALGANYFDAGKQLGEMISGMANGKKIEPLIQDTKLKELRVNEEVAEKLGIEIPAKIKTDKRLK